jgi:hypothetical protein
LLAHDILSDLVLPLFYSEMIVDTKAQVYLWPKSFPENFSFVVLILCTSNQTCRDFPKQMHALRDIWVSLRGKFQVARNY